MYEEPSILEKSPANHGFVPGDLLHGFGIGVWSDARNSHGPGLEVDEEENIVGDESTASPDLRREAIV